MLDNSEVEGQTPEEPQDTLAGGEDTVAAEAEELVVSIEGEDVEPAPEDVSDEELGEAGKRALKAAREAQKETARKLREKEARLAELEAQLTPAEPELKRPTMEDCGFNDEIYAERMADYVVKNREVEAEKQKEAERQKADVDAYNAKRDRYYAERGKVGIDDETEARVVSRFTQDQQAALMDASKDPAKVIAALSKTPKVLEELSGIKAIHKFTYRLAEIEGKITVTTKAPPPPESRVTGGAIKVEAIGGANLEKLLAQARNTGDYSAYYEAKRKTGAAGVKA